jgi:hypothetical protein
LFYRQTIIMSILFQLSNSIFQIWLSDFGISI